MDREPNVAPGERTCYRLYGLTLASDFPFTYHLTRADGPRADDSRADTPSDLRFSCLPESPDPAFWDRAERLYAAESRNGEHSGLYRCGEREVLRFAGIADFYLRPDEIICHLRDPAYAYGVEVWLLGTVCAYWLERRGWPAIHASAVVVEGRAAAFLAQNRGGKSSLAAALMQAGCPLLTDDILPLELRGQVPTGRPGYAQMRFWPDQAEHFAEHVGELGHVDDLGRVVPHLDKRRVPVGPGGMGTFCDAAQPLACFYLPLRRAADDPSTEIRIEPAAPMDGLKELVRHSFLPNLVEAAGLQPQRLKLLAHVAQRAPLRRLSYPSGVEHLPRVRQAILDDLRGM